MFLRWIVALVVLLAVTFGGVTVIGNFSGESANGSWALVTAIGVLAALVAYALVEFAQTRKLSSIAAQFDTRTIVLIPFAIAVNIILGQAVASALKVPIYLDSIGTILVGALAGPIPGALTGFLANTLWTYVVPPPFHSDFAAPFAIVAAVIGLMAGAFGRFGWLRPRLNRSYVELFVAAVVTVLVVGGMSYLAFLGYKAIIGPAGLEVASSNGLFVALGWLALALVAVTVVGLVALLFVRRDLTAAYVVVAGLLTGIICALISAPISANLFGGVTGAGTDFLVAAFRQAGVDVGAATTGQGLISDPIDKITTFFVVYIVLSAMARSAKARFPQGERLIDEATGGGDSQGVPA
jgi:hypothetical protein